MTITALVPVYREPKRAADIVRTLAGEARPEARIVVVVDGDGNDSIAAALAEIRQLPGVRIIEGQPHLGKAEALNRAVRLAGADRGVDGDAEGDGLLFIDNDIEIPAAAGLIARTEAMLAERDIAELPKVGRGEGLVAAMCRYEFLSNILATEYLARKAGRMPSINGAAFAVRRSLFEALGGFSAIVNEDMDFAARAFLEGARFGFDPAMTVGNRVPETAEDWLRQRKRWSINSALWSATYVEKVIQSEPGLRPQLGISGLLFPLPFLALLAGALIPGLAVDFSHGGALATTLAALGGAALAFAPVAALFARASRRYASPFGLVGFFAYSAIYLPIWGVASLSGMISVAFGKLPDLDWKHDNAADRKAVRAASIGGKMKESERERRRRLRPGRKAYSTR
jgi:GT2 family glycosyltransferase